MPYEVTDTVPFEFTLAPVRTKKATSSGRRCSACLRARSQVDNRATCPSNLGRSLAYCDMAQGVGRLAVAFLLGSSHRLSAV